MPYIETNEQKTVQNDMYNRQQ